MSEIVIQIPPLDEIDQIVEIEVKINGKKQHFNYRVEALKWESCEEPPEQRAICIKKMIDGYDKSWQLYHIGNPTDKTIPIMFKQKMN